MDAKFFVELALKQMGINQRELAAQLGVSPTQITKWKKGEHMSGKLQDKFRALTGIGDISPQVVLAAGSLEEAQKWKRLIRYLAATALENSETGYLTEPLSEEVTVHYGFLLGAVFGSFDALGIQVPKKFPKEIDFNYEASLPYSGADESPEEITVRYENPYSSAILSAFLGLNDLFGFYMAYILSLDENDDLGLEETQAQNIGPCLIDLAFAKLDLDPSFAPKFYAFRHQTFNDFERWINIVKAKAWEARKPIRTELMQLVTADNEELCELAQMECFGLHSSYIHPDTYINELLIGMRTIHQVLPAILEKLGIDDFELDPEALKP